MANFSFLKKTSGDSIDDLIDAVKQADGVRYVEPTPGGNEEVFVPGADGAAEARELVESALDAADPNWRDRVDVIENS